MAWYKSANYLRQVQSDDFDKDYNPGAVTQYSGIYRCMGCGREIVSERDRPLPPQNHHQHKPAQGTIRWRMIVYPNHEPQ